MLLRGGISGTQRIARHLWRMCFGLFIASGSVFLARQHLFPAILRTTGVLVFLSVAPLLLMIFWLLRVRFTKAFKTQSIPSGNDVQSARDRISGGLDWLKTDDWRLTTTPAKEL
jgi:hypothetical protein